MGMYAYVDFKAACPLCGLILQEWQTKDPEDLELQRVPVGGEVQNWYTNCRGMVYEDEDDDPPADARWIGIGLRRFRMVGCGAWIEYQDGVRTVTPKRAD